MKSESAPSPLADDEVLCISCGYSLRGLDVQGDCPECGVPIEKSLGGNRLANADPLWFARIRRGQALISIGTTASAWVIVGFALLGLVLALLSTFAWNFLLVILPAAMLVGAAAVVAGLIVCVTGAFMVTALEPRETLREQSVSARQLSRWSLLAAIGIVVVGIGLQSVGPLANQWWMRMLVFFGAAIASATAIWWLFRWLEQLAERIPDFELKTQVVTRQRELCGVLVGLALVNCATSALRAFLPPAQATPPQPFFRLTQISSCISALLWLALIFSIAHTAGTMKRYRKRLREIAPPSSKPG